MGRERNLTLDYFKLILSFLVILIHMQPLLGRYDLGGWLISNGIARIVVPCFFIISGYFISDKLNDKKALKKYLLHLLLVYMVWTLIYLPLYYDLALRSVVAIWVGGYYQLWYIPALILGAILLYGTKKILKNDQIILALSLFIFIVGYGLEFYISDPRIVRNGFFIGFPFITIGYYLKEKSLKVNSFFLIIFSLIGLALLMGESYMGYFRNFYQDSYFSTLIFCPALFLLVLKRSKYCVDKRYIGNLAAAIYYIHIIVITAIIPLSISYNIYKYPLVVAISILLSIVIIELNKRIKIFL